MDIQKKTKEVELKLQVSDKEENVLLQWLKKHAYFVDTIKQNDLYFDAKDKSFFHVDENGGLLAKQRLRIRQMQDKNILCYKRSHDVGDGKHTYNDEFEIVIDDVSKMKLLLQALGFEPCLEVKKTRQFYLYKEFEIALDNVEGLGNFVEIELAGQIDDVSAGLQSIYVLLEQIGLTNVTVITRGYALMKKMLSKE